jgi:diguanylate cyclase (GGDEF)-like protein
MLDLGRKRDRDLHTGLRNYRECLEDLGQALDDATWNVAFLLADLDGFMRLNARYGHAFCDDILRVVANVFIDRCKGCNAVPYRYGGQQFAVILQNASQEQAMRVAEALRSDVEKLGMTQEPFTISVGVAVAPVDGGKPTRLMAAADVALGSAKKKGRNQIRGQAEEQR